MAEFVRLKIRRQAGRRETPYWEEFKVNYRANMNVISALMEIQRTPVNAEGKASAPVIWECNCLEEVCGACTMIINGKARQACTALIDRLQHPIVLEPLSKFPVIRDLMVDRKVMFENLKQVQAWIPIDGTYDLGPGPRMAEDERQEAYVLSRCMTCGCCLEACPQYNSKSPFMGPQSLAQVKLFNLHPTGAMQRKRRMDIIMGEGGLAGCGNAQNCVKACPKEIPLTTTLAELNKEATLYSWQRWLKR